MADVCTGLMRPSDSWSSTEVRVLQHGHMWTIKGFSQCEVRYLETTVIVKDFANQKINFNRSSGNSSDLLASGSLTFKIRLHPQGNKESNKDFCFFQVFSCSNVTKFKAKFVVFNTQNDEIAATVYSGTQQLNGYFEYIRRDLLISHIQPQDEIQLLCNLTIVFDTVTRSSQNYNNHILPEPRPLELAHDLELMFNNDRHADFKIICQNEKESKEINVHKIILSARSPVFSAMFEQHTEEAQNNVVIFNDVDFEVMHEMLFYIYSGRSPALQLMAFDLLAAADRFQLSGLKEMADQILRAALTVDNVCRSLVLADMHNAFDLKNDAIRFIAQYSNNVIKTDGWNVMLKEHPRLVTEVVSAMSLQQEQIRFSTLSTIEPLVKRTRFDC